MSRRLLALALAAASALASCGAPEVPVRPYVTSDLVLLPRHTAFSACQCVFVHERPVEECRTWVRANPPIANWTHDPIEQTVTSAVAVFWGAKAHFVDAQVGCEILP